MSRYLCALAVLLWATLVPAASGPPRYRMETVAGGGSAGEGGPAVAAELGALEGIAADRFGNLFIAETATHRVRKIDAQGNITTLAGTGEAGFSGDGGTASAARLNHPYGLAADAAGNLYIADYGNQRVRLVTREGAILTVAGTGVRASGVDGGRASATALLGPRNVAVDQAGNLFVSEFDGHRVRRIAPGGAITTVAGTGVAGFSGDGGPGAHAQLSGPAGLAVSTDGALLIADSQNHRIRAVAPGKGRISTFLNTADGIDPGYTPPPPVALAAALDGRIYMTDGEFSIYGWTPGKGLAVVAGGGPGLSDDRSARFAPINAARDIAVDTAGNLYVADRLTDFHVSMGRVLRIDPAWKNMHIAAGDAFLHFIGDGGPAQAARLYLPTAAALDRRGNLYIADSGTGRIRAVNSVGGIRTLAGNGFNNPRGAELVAGTASQLFYPMGVAVDWNGEVLVADTYFHRVRRVDAAGLIRTVIGTNTTGSGAGAEDMPWDLAQTNSPEGVCAGPGDAFYIVDTANHRVLRAAPGALIATVAGNGSPGLAGDGTAAHGAQLAGPSACTVDSAGNLYIADTGNDRIRKVTPDGRIDTVAGGGMGGDGGAARDAALAGPRGVAVDGGGNLYIADTGHHRIRLVPTAGAIYTIAGDGQAGFAGDGGDAGAARLDTPAGLALDGAGDLYIADSANGRIRRLVPEAWAPAPVVAAPQITVNNAASLRQGPVAPGEVVAIFGTGLGPDAGAAGAFDAAGRLLSALAGVEVRFDGTPAPLFYAGAAQINAQAPYELAGRQITHVEAFSGGRAVAGVDVAVAATAPALFAVVVNQDGEVNSATAPAERGSLVTLYATGEGLRETGNSTGAAGVALNRPRLPVTLMVAGAPAAILYAGAAPGMVGVMQINTRVPGGFIAPGRQSVELSVGDAAAPAIPIWVK